MKNPRKLSEKIIVSNWFRQTIEKKFELNDWKVLDFLINSQVWTNKSTIILPITTKWKIIYLKEYRYWVEKYIINFPMWALEKWITINKNAKNELNEETGYDTNNLKFVWKSMVSNYDSTLVTMYVANNCSKIAEQDLSEWEKITVFRTSINKFEEMILDWKVDCPLTISCFYMAKAKGII